MEERVNGGGGGVCASGGEQGVRPGSVRPRVVGEARVSSEWIW